jgi:UDP:flavonoid glycosyltransferase YjiC (YdhE family)
MGQTMRVVAIAKELQRRGHEIKFLAGDKLISVIKGYGFDVIEFVNMPQMEFLLSEKSAEKSDQQEDKLQAMQKIMDKIKAMELEVGEKEQPDIMLCGTLTGVQAAKELGIPSIFVCLQPHGKKTLEMFSKGLRENDRLKTFFNEILEAASLVLIEGIPELGHEADFANDMRGTAISKKKTCFTGPLLIDDPGKMPEQEALKLRHIGDCHTKMVYVTIGGGSKLIGEQFLRNVVDAFRLLPMVKGVISAGLDIPPEEFSTFNPPEYVSIYEFVPGTEMIKASDVTVFHGGSSTLMTCLACGKPAVIIPSIGEQEDNAAVLVDHGAGIALEKENLTANILAEAIKQILQNGSYQRKAEELRDLCKVYGGAAAAASMIENVVQSEVLHV